VRFVVLPLEAPNPSLAEQHFGASFQKQWFYGQVSLSSDSVGLLNEGKWSPEGFFFSLRDTFNKIPISHRGSSNFQMTKSFLSFQAKA